MGGEQAEDNLTYKVVVNHEGQYSLWPADGVLQVRYGLSGRRLTMTITVTNPTAEEFPYGFGNPDR